MPTTGKGKSDGNGQKDQISPSRRDIKMKVLKFAQHDLEEIREIYTKKQKLTNSNLPNNTKGILLILAQMLQSYDTH